MADLGNIGLTEMWPVMEEQLHNGKSVKFIPEGISMLPMLRPGVDAVLLKLPVGKLKKYDLPLYRRESGQFVHHRVVKVDADSYVMCGDNQHVYEKGITDKNILAIVDSFYKDGEQISCSDRKYLNYCRKQVIKNRLKFYEVCLKRAVKRILRYDK